MTESPQQSTNTSPISSPEEGFKVEIKSLTGTFTGSLRDLALALQQGMVTAEELDVLALVKDYLAYYQNIMATLDDLDLATASLPDVARVIELKVRWLLPRPPQQKPTQDDDEVVTVVLELAAIEDAMLFLRQKRKRHSQLLPASTPPPRYPRKSRPITERTLQKLTELATRYRSTDYVALAIERISLPQAMRHLHLTLQKKARDRLANITAQAAKLQHSDIALWTVQVVYFAGMLELIKEGKIYAEQSDYDGDIELMWQDKDITK